MLFIWASINITTSYSSMNLIFTLLLIAAYIKIIVGFLGVSFFQKSMEKTFLQMLFIKKYDRTTFQLSLAITFPQDALGSGRHSEPHCPVLWWQQHTAETKSGLSLLLLLTPFPACEKDKKKYLLLLLAGSSNEGGSGSRVQVSIQQSF